MNAHEFVEDLFRRLADSKWTMDADFPVRLHLLVDGTNGEPERMAAGGSTFVIKASPYNWTVRTTEAVTVARASLSFDFPDDHGSLVEAQRAARATFSACALSISKVLGSPLAFNHTMATLEGERQWAFRGAVVVLELRHEDNELPYEVALSFRT